MPWCLENELRTILSDHLGRDKLVMNRRRPFEIRRTHYAEMINAPLSDIRFNGQAIFTEFENQARVRKAASIRISLRHDLEAGTVPLRSGAISRQWLQSRFGLSDRQIYECAEIRAEIEAANILVKSSGYIAKNRNDLLSKLKNILSSACPLAKGQLRVGMAQLAKQLGVSQGLLHQRPFVDAINEKKAQLRTGAHLPPTSAFFGEREWAFGDLAPAWPEQFLVRLAMAFKVAYLGQQEPRTSFAVVKDFLRWVAQSKDSFCRRAMSSCRGSGAPDETDWDDAVHSYHQHRIAKPQGCSIASIDKKLTALRTALNAISRDGLIPPSQSRIRGVKNAGRKFKPVPTIAQARRTTVKDTKEELVAFARDKLLKGAAELEIEVDEDDAVAFLQVLKDDAEHLDLRSAVDLSSAVLQIIDRRLSQLMDAATSRYSVAVQRLAEGSRLVATATLPSDFPEALFRLRSGSAERDAYMRASFPKPIGGKASDAYVANLLALARRTSASFIPSAAPGAELSELCRFMAVRYREIGGRQDLQSLLTPDADALASVLVMYLIQSGANVSVGLSLQLDCEGPCGVPGFTCITGHKLRANGKPIYAEFRAHSDFVKAIRWVREHCRPLRDLGKV